MTAVTYDEIFCGRTGPLPAEPEQRPRAVSETDLMHRQHDAVTQVITPNAAEVLHLDHELREHRPGT